MLVSGRGDSGRGVGGLIATILMSFDVSIGGQSMPKWVMLSLWSLDIGSPTFIPPSRSYPPSLLCIPTAFCLSHSHALPSTIPLHCPLTVQAIPVIAIIILFIIMVMPIVLHSFPSCVCR